MYLEFDTEIENVFLNAIEITCMAVLYTCMSITPCIFHGWLDSVAEIENYDV